MSNIVYNLRRQFGEKLADYPDALIEYEWCQYSQSEDYAVRDEEPERFLEWCENSCHASRYN